jgi:hypothetical protein
LVLADEGTIVADVQGNRDLHPSMENAIAAYLKARDQLQRDMDALDAYQSATNALYVAFVQGFSTTDRRTLCEAFGAFRKVLTRQHDANQSAIRMTELQ